MSVSVKVGSFVRNAGTGAQAITAIGFQPKALYIWTNNHTANGLTDAYVFCAGVTDGTFAVCFAGVSGDNLGAADVRRAYKEARIFLHESNAGVALAEASFASFDADGFTINWVLNDGVAAIVHYLAIGGDEVSAKVGVFDNTGSVGTQAITSVGFQPDTILFFESWATTTAESSEFLNYPRLGWCDSLRAGGAAAVSIEDTADPSHTVRHLSSTYPLTGLRSNIGAGFGSIYWQGLIDSYDANGFTIDWVTVNFPTAVGVYYLALRGVETRAGVITQPTVAGPQTVSLPGFDPTLVLFQTVGAPETASPVAEAQYSFGASDESSQRATWVGDLDDQATTVTARANRDDAVIQCATPAATGSATTINADASVSLDIEGFALDWATVDAVPRTVLYLAFVEPTGPVIDTLPASAVRSNQARIRGRIDPNGTQMTGRFAWGTDPDNLTNETDPESVGDGTSFVSYDFLLTGLTPETTYYFQALGDFGSPDISGEILSFTTSGEQTFVDGDVSHPLTWITTTFRNAISTVFRRESSARLPLAEVDLNDNADYYDGYRIPIAGGITLTGCAAAFNVPPHDESLTHHAQRPIPWAPGAFADAIAGGDVSVQLEYRDDLVLASQRAGTLRLWQDDDGLMFSACLDDSPLARAVADGVQAGHIRHCCATGQYGRAIVNAETGEHLAKSRARTLTINLLVHAISRPTFPGTWIVGGGRTG